MAVCLLQLCACSKFNGSNNRDRVFQTTLTDIRLGDGVPINLFLSIRWRIDDATAFHEQFRTMGTYDSLVLVPRGRELANRMSNTYPSVDSVFTIQREPYIRDLKQTLLRDLGEEGVQIKEIIVSDIIFPKTFTNAMEQIGLRERELEQIRLKNILDLEQAEAKRKKAKADGTVTIENAKIEGEVAEIDALTERKRRLTRLAQAETEAQVLEKQSIAEARKIQLLADAELQKQENLYNLEIQQKRNFLTVDKDNQENLAGLYQNNPAFASFLLNKELASKVQIAVVPIGTDASMVGNLLQNNLQKKQKQPIFNLNLDTQKGTIEAEEENEDDY